MSIPPARIFKLTLQQTGVAVALWAGLLMLPLAPLNTRFSAAGIILFIAVAFGSRNIVAIGCTAALFNLTARFFNPGSSWQDQHWIQWTSISSLLTGNHLFATSPLYQFSLSSYMPAGDLFGGLFIALGIQQYWLVWHVLVLCLVALPVLLAPSLASLLLFLAFSAFYPFCDYTTGGGTLEIGYALSIGAVALFRSQRLLTASLVLFAFAAMFRQPSVILIPFLLLILWRNRDYRRIALFATLLFVFGGVYIVTYPQGAYHYLYSVWDGYHQGLFNEFSGLRGNYSISSIPMAFGAPDSIAWYGWKAFYLPIMLCGLALFFAIAWFRKSRDEVLILGFIASATVYLLSRGYSQYGYVCTSLFPLAAFLYPVPSKLPMMPKRIGQSLALIFVWIGTVPLALWVVFWSARQVENFRPFAIVHAFEVHQVGSAIALPTMDGTDANSHIFPISATVEFKLPSPQYLSGVRLSGDHLPIKNLKGILMRAPNDIHIQGVVTEGLIEGSENGIDFHELRHFHNPINYCVWPATISLPTTAQPLKAIRIKPLQLYLGYEQWILGNVEFLSAVPGNKGNLQPPPTLKRADPKARP